MTELENRLIRRLQAEGAIPFREFMRMALYDPELGYYNSERLKIGPSGDYYTSSNVHPVFGAILAQAFAGLWHALEDGGQLPLTLIEMGAGTGQLALDLLTALRREHPACFARTRYVIVEASPAMRARQAERLSELSALVTWRELADLEEEPLTAVAFSNELIDAMPVHRARFQRGDWQEQFVILQGTAAGTPRLALSWREVSTPEVERYLQRLMMPFAEGQIIEVNLEAIDWLRRLSGALARGHLVTIDYGDLAPHLYAPDRRDGTLRCFSRHALNVAPLERIGEQDITASVNFTALQEYGREYGFTPVSYERQANFLFRHGLIERIAALDAGGTIASMKDRLAVKNLLAPGGVSDNFRVLIQKKE